MVNLRNFQFVDLISEERQVIYRKGGFSIHISSKKITYAISLKINRIGLFKNGV